MKFGLRNTSFVYLNGTGQIWEDTKTQIQRAERDGFHSFWVMDHFYQLPVHGSEEEPFLDAWTILPALATMTMETMMTIDITMTKTRKLT